MNSLVQKAIDAHGGLERWRQVQRISATFQPSGVGLKQRGPLGEALTLAPMRVEISTKIQRVDFVPFLTSGQTGIYEPLRTAVETGNGRVIEELKNPREMLESVPAGTAWTAPQLVYFLGYSLWMYHTLPFSFLEPGVVCEETDPWQEDDETWDGLKVTYPDTFPAHSKEQIHYFDANGLMRRQDYAVDVRQDLKVAHYLFDHQTFDAFVFARKRRICLRGPNGAPLWDRTLISAELDNFVIKRT